MDADGLAGPSDRGEALVDEELPLGVIEGAFPTDEVPDLADVGGVVDQPLKRLPTLARRQARSGSERGRAIAAAGMGGGGV